jgi:AcrR family transcriptional regulator
VSNVAKGSEGNRQRIIAAASRLLSEHGVEAVSTRAVCAAAEVQAPTVYRLFGDKHGLLDAVAADGLRAYAKSAAKAGTEADPVQELRDGWDQHVAFGLSHPQLYALVYGTPRPEHPSSAARTAIAPLVDKVGRVAEAGRLRVSEDIAVQLIYAAGCGTVLTLLNTPEDKRDPDLSPRAREAVISAVTVSPPDHMSGEPQGSSVVSSAIALRASIGQSDALSLEEAALLRSWLTRIIDNP